MGFFESLKRMLTHHPQAQPDEAARKKLREVWGLAEEPEETAPPEVEAAGVSEYDRDQWRKKLRKILDELPDSQDHWHVLMTEAHALNLEPEWLADRQREEFAFLIRRAVADRVVSEQEHDRIELARKLIGLPESEAEQTLKAIMAEAEAFFGKPVRDEV